MDSEAETAAGSSPTTVSSSTGPEATSSLGRRRVAWWLTVGLVVAVLVVFGALFAVNRLEVRHLAREVERTNAQISRTRHEIETGKDAAAASTDLLVELHQLATVEGVEAVAALNEAARSIACTAAANGNEADPQAVLDQATRQVVGDHQVLAGLRHLDRIADRSAAEPDASGCPPNVGDP